jgi:hypothetical protein
MDDVKETIRVSKKLYDEIAQKVNSGEIEFASVDAFVEFVLAEVLGGEQQSAMTPEDEQIVSKRLKDLGY